MVRALTNSWGGGSQNLMLSSNLLKSKIPICGGEGGFAEYDVEFKFAKIQNSHLCVCVWGGGGGKGGFTEFDVEFKFAKIQNSHLWGGRGGSRNMMLSSNLLKSKIPICVCVGGGKGGFAEFDVEFKFAKIQNSHLWGGGGGLVEPISNF